MIINSYAFAPIGPSYDSLILALSPWGYWKLDENSMSAGGSAVDASGNARHGTYSPSPPTSVAGLFGSSPRAGTFNGANNDVGIPSYTLAASQKFSIVSFMQTSYASATAKHILSGDIAGSQRWQFRISSGKIQFITITPSVTTTAGGTTVSDNLPHMVAVVFDPTLAAGAGRVKIYVDGVVDTNVGANPNPSTSAITISAGSVAPGIGARNASTHQENWAGPLDNVALFDTDISAANIAALWAARNNT